MITSRDRLLDLLDKIYTGPVMEDFHWDSAVIPKAIKKYLKQYNLAQTCNSENPINTDDDLADQFFQAGMDMAVEVGMLCTDTHRVIKYDRDELLFGLKTVASEYTIGEGKDIVTYKARKPEDPAKPIWIAPLSIQVTEDVFKPIQEGIAQIPELDVIEGPSLENLWGQPVRGGSPSEQLASVHHAELTQETLQNVGRSGLGRHCSPNATTHYGVLGSYGIAEYYKPGRDIVLGMNPAEIKTGYDSLYRMVQVYNAGNNGRWGAGSYAYIGGSAGSPEGAVICNIANTILTITALQTSSTGYGVYDVRYLGNTDRKAQWALGMVTQALSRNTKAVIGPTINSLAGPATKMLLYENAIGMMNITVSGTATVVGVRSAGGKYVNYLTPLEHKFAGKVLKRCAGMSRETANEIAKDLFPKYEKMLTKAPKGKSFKDCYNIKRLEPSSEWQQMYQEVTADLMNLGISME